MVNAVREVPDFLIWVILALLHAMLSDRKKSSHVRSNQSSNGGSGMS